MLLGLLVEFVHAGLPKDMVLPLQIVSLAWVNLYQESNRISVPKRLYYSHVAGLSNSCIRTCETMFGEVHITPRAKIMVMATVSSRMRIWRWSSKGRL